MTGGLPGKYWPTACRQGSTTRIDPNEGDPKTTAEILTLLSRLTKDSAIATSNLEMQTVINILNQTGCGCDGARTSQNGSSITVEGDNPPQVEGESTDNLLECGCADE